MLKSRPIRRMWAPLYTTNTVEDKSLNWLQNNMSTKIVMNEIQIHARINKKVIKLQVTESDPSDARI